MKRRESTTEMTPCRHFLCILVLCLVKGLACDATVSLSDWAGATSSVFLHKSTVVVVLVVCVCVCWGGGTHECTHLRAEKKQHRKITQAKRAGL